MGLIGKIIMGFVAFNILGLFFWVTQDFLVT